MRTAIVSTGFIGQYPDLSVAEEKANEMNGNVCHLLLQNRGLQATFGFAVEKDGEIIGCNDFKWI